MGNINKQKTSGTKAHVGEGTPLMPKKPMVDGIAGTITSTHTAFARLYALVGKICETKQRPNLFSTAQYLPSNTNEGGEAKPAKFDSVVLAVFKRVGGMHNIKLNELTSTYAFQVSEAQGLLYAFTRKEGAAMLAELFGEENATSVSNSLQSILHSMDALAIETELSKGDTSKFSAPTESKQTADASSP